MHRFWETVIEPVFEILQPQVIVEIGSARGDNTKKILEFCRRGNATLHVIDPMPGYNVSDWEREYDRHLVFHKDLSLNVLPHIGGLDASLIDGDHNWFTVFNELKLIENRCNEDSRNFPVVMLHDVGWPYGRRDVYYEPGRIPERHLNPYAQRGMRLGLSELQENGGFNRGFHNALREGGSQNGVITAVEDFIAQTDQDLRLMQLPGMYGLGILIPSHVRESTGGFLETLELPPNIYRHIERVEKAFIEAETARQENNIALRQLERRRASELENSRNRMQQQNANLQKQNDALRQRLERVGRKDWQPDNPNG